MKQPALGNTISTFRNQKGLTQKELAEACNMDIRTIQRIEAGEVTPRMYSIRLLAAALGCDTGIFTAAPGVTENVRKASTADLKWPFWAGMVFSINAIAVVFDLTTRSFNTYFHVCTLMVHAASCIFFFKGFYLIGKQYNNEVLAISSLLAMVLLPLVNVFYLLNAYYAAANYILFILLCINNIINGIGFLTEGYKRKGQYRVNLYMIAGFTIIIQNAMFLTPDRAIIAAALILSLFGNMVTTTILYTEYNDGRRAGGMSANRLKSLF